MRKDLLLYHNIGDFKRNTVIRRRSPPMKSQRPEVYEVRGGQTLKPTNIGKWILERMGESVRENE